jgi:hypothetical protein
VVTGNAAATRANLADKLASAISTAMTAAARAFSASSSYAVVNLQATNAAAVIVATGSESRLVVSGTSSAKALTLSGTFVASDSVSFTVNGVAVQYTVVSADVVAGDDAATRMKVAAKLATAVNTAMASATAAVTASSVRDDGLVNVSAVTAGAVVALDINSETRMQVSGTDNAKVLSLTATFAAGNTVALTVNGTAVSYTVVDADAGATAEITRANVAAKIASVIQAALATASSTVTATTTSTFEFVKLKLQPETAGATLTITNADARLQLTAVTGGHEILLTGTYASGDTLSITVNGTAVSYTVLSSDVVAGDAVATRDRITQALGNAITAQAPKLVKVADAAHATVTEVSTLTVQSGIGGAAPVLSSTDARLQVTDQKITVQGTFVVDQVLSLTVNSTAVSYKVTTADIGETADITRNRLAIALADAISVAAPRLTPVVTATGSTTTTTTAGVSTSVTELRISQIQGQAQFTLALSDARLAVQHNPSSELSNDQQLLVASKLRPALDVQFKDLTAAQKTVVLNAIAAQQAVTQYFNYSALPGKKLVSDFTQGVITDYTNANVVWGSAGTPSANATFASLTPAQKDVVAHAQGYERYDGLHFFKADALLAEVWVSGFTQGGGAFDLSTMDWGGVAAPAAATSFEQLTVVQRNVVLKALGYDIADRQVYRHTSGDIKDAFVEGTGAGADYDALTFAWGTVVAAAPGTLWTDLTLDQQDIILSVKGYTRWDGLVFHKAGATTPYKLSFVQGTDYTNSAITWNTLRDPSKPDDTGIPVAGTALASLNPEQKALVLEQAGLEEHSGTVYYKANAAAGKQLVTSFTVDYSQKDAPATPTKRWLLTDGTNRYMVYAYDKTNDGVAEAIQIMEPHVLLGQRGAGFLLTGTITTLQDNADFVIDVKDDAIVSGGFINLLGAGSDLSIASDRSVFWQGEGNINGNITLTGRGSQGAGMPLDGVSVYVHASTTLSSTQAGSSITINGRDDVEIQGAVLAGAVRDSDGTRYLGADSTISITAGQQILLNNSLAAAKSVKLKTTGAPGADDQHIAILLDTVAGISAGGWTSDRSGGLVDIDAIGTVVLGGMVLSGGRAVQSFNSAGRLTGETITWTDELSTVRIRATGQLDLGIDTLAQSGSTVTVGGRVLASQLIDISGGANSDHIGVRLPETAVLAVSNPDGVLKIRAAQDAWLTGQMLAGGQVLGHYDAAGYKLGNTVQSFGGNSEIHIVADEQVILGRDLIAGKVIDVRGGTSSHTTEAELALNPWADEGIVIGGNVQIKTLQDYSSITLSAGGDMSVLTPAWTQEIVADDFVEYADGHLSTAATFALTLELGTVDEVRTITLGTTRGTEGLGGLGKVVFDLQKAIDTAFAVPKLSDGKFDEKQRKITVRLDDGRLMLTGNYEMRIAAVTDGGAERLGFTQIKAVAPTAGRTTSERGYAIDASGRGSVVNLGKASAPAGAITIAGAIRGYSAVNMYAGATALGAAVTFSATSLLETLDGSMVMNPAGATTLEGDFIARGANASIIINGTGTLALKGNLTAQRDILISAGTTVAAGEVSIHTYGTSHFTTLDAGGRIVLTGLNDVVIDSTIGKGNPSLGLLQVGSTAGSLSLLATSGWLESGSNIVLSGKDVDIAGVVRNNQASAVTYDNELTITATQDVRLHGAVGIVGSMLITAGDDIEVSNMALSAQSTGHSLRMVAVDAITLGGTAANTAVIAEADALLSLKAGGLLTVYENAFLFSTGDKSAIQLEAQAISMMGSARAGANHPFAYNPASESMAFDSAAQVTYTGKAATLDIKTSREFTLGNTTTGWGGQLFATGAINVQTGSNLAGTGFDMTAASQVKVDATGYNTWRDSLVDASGWKIVAGVTYSVTIGSTSFQSQADTSSTINTVLDALVSQINSNASYAANRAGDVLTLTLKDGSLLSATVSAGTSTTPAVGTAAVVLGNATAPVQQATVTTTDWAIVAGARYGITIGTGSAAQRFTVTAGKDYTLAMVTEELARLIKQSASYTASIAGNVLTIKNAGATSATTDDTVYVGDLSATADASAGTAAITVGNSNLLTDGQLSIVSDGYILLRGAVSTVDVGSDMVLRSRSMINVGALVTAQQSMTLRAGIDSSKIGVWLQELLLDASGNYKSGGTLDTASGGSIDIESVDGITITGVLGQRQMTDGDLGGAKVGSIRIESLAGDVNLLRNTNVRDTLTVAGNRVGVLSGSYVYATGAGSSLYLKARNALVLSGLAPAAGLDAAIAKAANLVHMVAPTMTINGTIDVTSLTGRALLSAGSAVTVGGTIVSKGGIDVHAGVNMTWTRDQMEAPTITRAMLSGGNITIAGQGLLQAVGTVNLLAGGNVTLNADANVSAIETVKVPVYTTVEQEVQVVVDTIQVADGVVQVPEVTWVPTLITEQVGTERVVVGSSFETMNVNLQQIGYFNPNVADNLKFVEVLIEGVHYLNSNYRQSSAPGYAKLVNWANAGNEQVPVRSVAEGDRPSGDPASGAYKAFTQLSDAQKWAVFNASGYLPLYDFGYTNWKLNQTINGTASALAEGTMGSDGKALYPAWKPNGVLNAKDVFLWMWPIGATNSSSCRWAHNSPSSA